MNGKPILSGNGYVAPFTGAWIETGLYKGEPVHGTRVAPFTGAWIET